MNKKLFWALPFLLTLILSACGSSPRTSGPDAVELPTQTKISLGVLKLEETDSAITAEQAQELIPMFYVLQDLNESDTAAQEEIDGLVNQIQETMTREQVQAINSMSLSMRDVMAYVQGGGNGAGASVPPSTGLGGDFAPPSGGGNFPGGGGGNNFPGGNNANPGGGTGGAIPPSGGTMPEDGATGNRPSMTSNTPSALFDAIIELLQKKSQ
jgi:hypothetical protein